MRIRVRIYTGHTAPLRGRRVLAEKCISLEVSLNDTVLTVKALLQQLVHVTPKRSATISPWSSLGKLVDVGGMQRCDGCRTPHGD